MSALGILVALLGIWILINAFNGNLYDVLPSPLGGGKKSFNVSF